MDDLKTFGLAFIMLVLIMVITIGMCMIFIKPEKIVKSPKKKGGKTDGDSKTKTFTI